MTLSIMDYDMRDADDLIALTTKTIRHSYGPIIGVESVEGFIGSGAVESFYLTPQFIIFVAHEGDITLGCGAINGNRIEMMMVDHNFHRQKIGTHILIEAEKRIFGTHQIAYLDSFKNNVRANDFYKHHGWTLDHEFIDPDHNIDMLRLSKTKP